MFFVFIIYYGFEGKKIMTRVVIPLSKKKKTLIYVSKHTSYLYFFHLRLFKFDEGLRSVYYIVSCFKVFLYMLVVLGEIN